MTKRKSYTKEFKLEAVRLLDSGDKTATQIINELGIRRNLLYKWQAEFRSKGTDAFRGRGRKPAGVDELADLKRENERLKEENEILKKAAAYFARELK